MDVRYCIHLSLSELEGVEVVVKVRMDVQGVVVPPVPVLNGPLCHKPGAGPDGAGTAWPGDTRCPFPFKQDDYSRPRQKTSGHNISGNIVKAGVEGGITLCVKGRARSLASLSQLRVLLKGEVYRAAKLRPRISDADFPAFANAAESLADRQAPGTGKISRESMLLQMEEQVASGGELLAYLTANNFKLSIASHVAPPSLWTAKHTTPPLAAILFQRGRVG